MSRDRATAATDLRPRARLCLGLLAAAVVALLPAGASGAGADELTAVASARELPYRAPLTLSGLYTHGGAPVAGAPLALQADVYPYRADPGFVTLARASTAADGSYSFAPVELERDVRLRVLAEGTPARSSDVQVFVDPLAALGAADLGAGRERLSIRLTHADFGAATPFSARWFLAARGSRHFQLADVTQTRELSTGSTYASATVDPPAKRFSFRVCLEPAWRLAMGPPAARRTCPSGDFTAPASAPSSAGPEFAGEGHGTPQAAYPTPDAVAAATRFLDERAGRTSFAVIDSSGRLGGTRLHEHFESASVVKVMFMTAYLQMLAARGAGLDEHDRSLLYPMIHESNNDDASAVLGAVGESAIARVARESGMSDYAPGVGWWAFDQTSAADQARLFFELARLIPPQFYAYARGLLSTIEPEQSWGAPPVARPDWEVFFKTGALPSQGLFNEAARLERGGVMFTIAVFTDGDPSMSYGEQTIEGVTSRLLGR